MTSMKLLRMWIVAALLAAAAGLASAHGGVDHFLGTVKTIAESSITIETPEHKEVSFATDAKTEYQRGAAVATAKDLKVGDRVAVNAKKSERGLIALLIKLGKAKENEQPAK